LSKRIREPLLGRRMMEEWKKVLDKQTFKKTMRSGALLLVMVLTTGIYLYSNNSGKANQERGVSVIRVEAEGPEPRFLPRNVLFNSTTDSRAFIFLVDHLRTRKVPVEIVSRSEEGILVKKGVLLPGALVLISPGDIQENEPVWPVEGMSDEAVIRQVLNSGSAAIARKDSRECLRFTSPQYQDPWGYNIKLIEAFLKKAFKEFSDPRMEFSDRPGIRVSGNQAMVQIAVRLRAGYQGHTNYLLGDAQSFNTLILLLEKKGAAWKVIQVQGLKPLGFDEKFMKLIGSEIGLPLNPAEQQERQKACMPCRERMNECFLKRESGG
jgi:hypothetical protein